ncbi:MAG: hypothetical protein L0Z50_27140 [Verrucomicrobiales bacterium]|nr:hypothetical protein [Verrucomicrobiales bacterium]
MDTPEQSLSRIIERLQKDGALGESELQLLSGEVERLELAKRVHEAGFENPEAPEHFGVLPSVLSDIARRAQLSQWVKAKLNPPDSESCEELSQDGDSVQGADASEDITEVFVNDSDTQSSEEETDRLQLLTQEEEKSLFLAYNYARYRLAPIAASVLSQKDPPLEMTTELVSWIKFATDVRDTIIEFHYPFLIGIARRLTTQIFGQYNYSLPISSVFGLGCDGLRQAINTYDSGKGVWGLRSFAQKHVTGEILRWFKNESEWSKKTRPTKEPKEGQTREWISVKTVLEGLEDEGWAITGIQQQGVSVGGPPSGLENFLPEDETQKLSHFVTLARLRQSAAQAADKQNSLEAFQMAAQQALGKTPLMDDSDNPDREAGFAPAEWQRVWQRRASRIRAANSQ